MDERAEVRCGAGVRGAHAQCGREDGSDGEDANHTCSEPECSNAGREVSCVARTPVSARKLTGGPFTNQKQLCTSFYSFWIRGLCKTIYASRGYLLRSLIE